MIFKEHPSREELDDLAMNRSVTSRTRRHAAKCAECKRVLDDLRRDADLVARLREAAELLADQNTRDAIDVCIESGRPPTP